MRKRNVRRDHNVERLHVFYDPIIGGVKSVRDNLQGNPSFIRNSHPRIGHQGDIELTSTGDAVDFLFYRTRIRIDKDVQQLNIPPRPESVYSNFSTIIIHPNNLASPFSLNTFYIPIDDLFHGYRVMTGEIGLIFFDGILD